MRRARKNRPSRNVFLPRIVMFPPRKHRTLALVRQTQMRRIPFPRLIPIRSLEKDPPNSNNPPTLLRSNRRLRLFSLRSLRRLRTPSSNRPPRDQHQRTHRNRSPSHRIPQYFYTLNRARFCHTPTPQSIHGRSAPPFSSCLCALCVSAVRTPSVSLCPHTPCKSDYLPIDNQSIPCYRCQVARANPVNEFSSCEVCSATNWTRSIVLRARTPNVRTKKPPHRKLHNLQRTGAPRATKKRNQSSKSVSVRNDLDRLFSRSYKQF